MSAAQVNATEDLADRLHSVSIHLLRSLRRQDAKSGVSAARLSALSVIFYSPNITMSRLAAVEQVKLPTMSRLISGMEHDGLVRRSTHAEDARVVTVAITAVGRKVVQQSRDSRLAALGEQLSKCSDQELQTLQESVGVLERLFGGRHT